MVMSSNERLEIFLQNDPISAFRDRVYSMPNTAQLEQCIRHVGGISLDLDLVAETITATQRYTLKAHLNIPFPRKPPVGAAGELQ